MYYGHSPVIFSSLLHPSHFTLHTSHKSKNIYHSETSHPAWTTLVISTMSSSFFWDVTQYRLVIPYRRFGAAYRPHLQGSRSLGCSSVLTSQWALRFVSSATARCCPVGTTVRCVILHIYNLLQLILTYAGLYISSNIYIYQEWRKAACIWGYGLCWNLVSFPVSLNRTGFVYSLKMPVSPVCMVDVVLLTRNFLLLYFSFLTSSFFMLLTWHFICSHASFLIEIFHGN